MSGTMSAALKHRDEVFTPRQQAVLTAALELLVEGGDALTMTAVARRASCSKETLYKWFGDRDGLLTATVQWQAAKVRVPHVDRHRLDATTLRGSVEAVAIDMRRLHLGGLPLHGGGEQPVAVAEPLVEGFLGARGTARHRGHGQPVALLDEQIQRRRQHLLLARRERFLAMGNSNRHDDTKAPASRIRTLRTCRKFSDA